MDNRKVTEWAQLICVDIEIPWLRLRRKPFSIVRKKKTETSSFTQLNETRQWCFTSAHSVKTPSYSIGCWVESIIQSLAEKLRAIEGYLIELNAFTIFTTVLSECNKSFPVVQQGLFKVYHNLSEVLSKRQSGSWGVLVLLCFIFWHLQPHGQLIIFNQGPSCNEVTQYFFLLCGETVLGWGKETQSTLEDFL